LTLESSSQEEVENENGREEEDIYKRGEIDEDKEEMAKIQLKVIFKLKRPKLV